MRGQMPHPEFFVGGGDLCMGVHYDVIPLWAQAHQLMIHDSFKALTERLTVNSEWTKLSLGETKAQG